MYKRQVENTLNGKGRVLLRYSGTEPVARIMVEAEDPNILDNSIDYLKDAVIKSLG